MVAIKSCDCESPFTIFPPINHENLLISPDPPLGTGQISFIVFDDEKISSWDSGLDSDSGSNSTSTFSPVDSSLVPCSSLYPAAMGKREGGVVNRVADERWFWAASSIGQLGWGIWAFRRGCAGDSRFMPLKSFAIASLFVGAAASVTVGSLRASGIYSVEDCRSLGANIRTGLGLHRRTPKE